MAKLTKWTAFRVKPGEPVDLRKWPTRIDPWYDSKEDYRTQLDEARAELSQLQDVLYADGRYALLIIFQALDAAGKDSAIKHVMSGVNPQGCRVHSFKTPSDEELAHDFLWRAHLRLPERGMIGIFNRSYYEEVLVVRVHPEWLERQRLPDECVNRKNFWRERLRDIVRFEDYLVRNGTRIVKIHLHVSREEQRKRFLKRLEDPTRNWKFSPADLEVRDRWDEYRAAYEECLERTSTRRAPWYVVPADDKKTARLIISRILVRTLRGLDLRYPPPKISARERSRLRRLLEKP